LAGGAVVRDTGHAGTASTDLRRKRCCASCSAPTSNDKFVQLFDPQGNPGFRSMPRALGALPLSPEARANARRGVPTFETVELPHKKRVRVVTLPLIEGGRVAQLIQAGMPLERMDHTLGRYVQTLLVLVPLGVLLAAAGGAVTARIALRRVDEMTRTARRITGRGPLAADPRARPPVTSWTGWRRRSTACWSGSRARWSSSGVSRPSRPRAAHAAHGAQGSIEVALRTERSGEEYRAVLASSLEEVERVSRLAEDLLLLSRLTAGVEEERTRADLEPLVLEVFDVGSRLARGDRRLAAAGGGGAGDRDRQPIAQLDAPEARTLNPSFENGARSSTRRWRAKGREGAVT